MTERPTGTGETTVSPINLPVTVLPPFTCDELSLIYGSSLTDAAFVVDRQTALLAAANERFLELIGRSSLELEDHDVPFGTLLTAEDQGIFRTWLSEEFPSPSVSFVTRLVDAEDQIIPVEVAAKRIRWRGRDYLLGFARPCGERLRREQKLREQVALQKSRALQALKSSLRVYELNEKIKSTLELTTALLNVENEEQLYTESLKILTNPEGLNFRDVTILAMDGSELRVVSSTLSSLPLAYSLAEDNKYARSVRDGFQRPNRSDGSSFGHEVLVPLRSRESLLGVIEVVQHPREKAFFDEYRLITEWQLDMLVQIGDVIALLLDNLRLKRELKRQSIIDPLTGAYNRNFFMTRLNTEIRRACRYGRPVSLLFLDVDHFKEVNDRYGHLQGDNVLRELGKLFLGTLRKVDILCRYGGDEFVVILPEANDETMRMTADKVRRAVKVHHFPNIDAPHLKIPVTVSIGMTTLRSDQSAEEFLNCADEALYRAKQAGRDCGASG